MRSKLTALLVAAVAVTGLGAPAAAQLPPDGCPTGELWCVDAVIDEMEGRFDALAASCDHDAVFALTYLRTTEEYRQAATEGTFFRDTAFVNHQDVLFARYYFDAYDAWHSGDRAGTPPAWRIAFEAADRGQVSALGNLLLGMSAHVNRDLPFVLAELGATHGLTHPDGTSRKDDHDQVNAFLVRVAVPLMAELAQRFDPTIDDIDVPWTTLDQAVVLRLLFSWRELAWHNAQALVAAPTPAARAAVAASIEATAAVQGRAMVLATAYGPLHRLFGVDRAARDAHCLAQLP